MRPDGPTCPSLQPGHRIHEDVTIVGGKQGDLGRTGVRDRHTCQFHHPILPVDGVHGIRSGQRSRVQAAERKRPSAATRC